MIVCKVCGATNEQGATFCGTCGAFLEWSGEQVQPDGATAAVATPGGPPPVPPPGPGPTAGDPGPIVDTQPVPVPIPPTRSRSPPGSIICSNCGMANDPTRVYCSRCATELAAVAAARIAVVAPRRPPAAHPARRDRRRRSAASLVLGVLAFVFLVPKIPPRSRGPAPATEPPPRRSQRRPQPSSASAPAIGRASSLPRPASAASAPPPARPLGTLVFSVVKDDNADVVTSGRSPTSKPHDPRRRRQVRRDRPGVLVRWLEASCTSRRPAPSDPIDGSTGEGLRIVKADGGTATVPDFTHHDVDRNPAWSPDDKTIAFASTRDSRQQQEPRHLLPPAHRRDDHRTCLLAADPADDWDPAYVGRRQDDRLRLEARR